MSYILHTFSLSTKSNSSFLYPCSSHCSKYRSCHNSKRFSHPTPSFHSSHYMSEQGRSPPYPDNSLLVGHNHCHTCNLQGSGLHSCLGMSSLHYTRRACSSSLCQMSLESCYCWSDHRRLNLKLSYCFHRSFVGSA